jgi:hypothetical protein
VDPKGRPLAFDASELPVFRVEVRLEGMSGVPASWSTRPELKYYSWIPGP